MERRVFVVVPVFNRKKIVVNFLENILKQVYSNFHVIIVDDRSPDGTFRILNELFGSHRNLTILETEGGKWWAGTIHVGIQTALNHATPGDYILLMNDDINFEEDLIFNLVRFSKRNNNAVVSGVEVVNGRVKATGSRMLCWPLAITIRPYSGISWPNKSLPEKYCVDFLGARASLYPVSILMDIGNVNSEKLPHYHADGELSYRAKRSGYEVLIDTKTPIYSIPSSTGLFNTWENKHDWSDLVRSLFYFKSINNINHRWQFAKLTAPKIWIIPYFISHVSRAVIKSIFMVFISKTRKAKNDNR